MNWKLLTAFKFVDGFRIVKTFQGSEASLQGGVRAQGAGATSVYSLAPEFLKALKGGCIVSPVCIACMYSI